jgi:thymidine kinase
MQEIMYRNAVAGAGLVVNHQNDEVRQSVEVSGGAARAGETAVAVAETRSGAARAGSARSHDGKRCAAVFASRLVPDVVALPAYAAATWVAVDETQFFDRDDVQAFVMRARYLDRKNLVLAGLHADDQGACFMDFNMLLVHCTSFKLLSARCQVPGCLALAHHTHAAFDKRSKVDFSHTDEYRAMCDFHFLQAKLDATAASNQRRQQQQQ